MDASVCELFAGVGGFRLGLQWSGWKVIWSNQWEPGRTKQYASDCYVAHFGKDAHANIDIAKVKQSQIPSHDLLVGGFPCQDYSVATTKAQGILGKKGVLWWQIYNIVQKKSPPYVLLENVDRLIKSPSSQRGRDFGILLWCLQNKGYAVEWRVVNAADYGAPQRRRRTFIFAAKADTTLGATMKESADPVSWVCHDGIFGTAFPVTIPNERLPVDSRKNPSGRLMRRLQDVSDTFRFRFGNSGLLIDKEFWTFDQLPVPTASGTLGSVLQSDVSEQYYIPENEVDKWAYLKGAKREPRKASTGFRYYFSEGSLPFPDYLNRPSRTIMTSEGGGSPSRFKHVVSDPNTGRLRRLTPVECERLNQFPDEWTNTGMPEGWRYFCMGNALVVGLIRNLGHVILEQINQTANSKSQARPVLVARQD